MRAMHFMTMSVVVFGLLVGCGGEKGGSTSDTASEATGEPSTSAADESDSDSGGVTTGGAGDDICGVFADWSLMCDPEAGSREELVAGCEESRTEFDPTCVPLFDAGLECSTKSMCDDDAACAEQIEAFYACAFPVSEACMAYGAKQAECTMAAAEEEAQLCQIQLDESTSVDPACGMAFEQYFACMGEQTCADLEMGVGCEAETMALAVCDG